MRKSQLPGLPQPTNAMHIAWDANAHMADIMSNAGKPMVGNMRLNMWKKGGASLAPPTEKNPGVC